MPIPVTRLHEAQAPLRERVLKYLEENRDQAFTMHELYVGIHKTPSQTPGAGTSASELGTMLGLVLINPASRERILGPLTVAISGLIAEGKVQAAEVQGARYYALVT